MRHLTLGPAQASRCSDASHRAAKWLHVLAPDLSELVPIGQSELGAFYNCPRCSTTLLVPAPQQPPDTAPLRVAL